MADTAMAEAQGGEDPLSLPPHGTEVFIGGLPRNITEQQLRDFASEAGDVHSAKLIKDPNNPSQNRGYGFVKYYSKESAVAAMDSLHQRELPGFPGSKLRIQPSQAKHKLFIGGIPHELTREGLASILNTVVKGLEKVEMVKSKDPLHPEQNRGFAFLEFYNSACASAAKSILSQPDFKIGEKTPTVDYAEPSQRETQASAGGQVKNVFVGNLPYGATEDRLKDIFSKYGEVERAHIPRPRDGDTHSKFGFVHFRDRVSAMRAVQDDVKPEIEGSLLNVRYGKTEGGQQQQQQQGGGGGGGGSGMGRGSGGPYSSGPSGGYGASSGGTYSAGPAGSYGSGGGDMGGMAAGMAGMAGMGGMGGMGMPPMGMMMGNNLVSLVPVQLPNGQIGYMMGGMPAGGAAAGSDTGGAGGPVRGSAAYGGAGSNVAGSRYGGPGVGAPGMGAGRGRGRGPGGPRYQPY